MKKRKFLALLLMCAMIVSCFSGSVKAKAAGDYVVTTNGALAAYTMVPGEEMHFSIPVRLANVNYYIRDYSSIVVMVSTDDGVFDTTEAVLTRENMSANNQVGISYNYTTNIEFDLTLKDTTKIGAYDAKISLKFDGYDYLTGDAVSSAEIPFTIRVRSEKTPAQVTVDAFSYDEALAAVGATFDLTFDARNEGEIAALNTYVTVDYTGSGIVPNYSIQSIKIGDLLSGAKSTQRLPVRVLPGTEPGIKTLTINYEYKDVDGTSHTASRNVYVNILAASTAPSDDAKLTAEAAVLNAEVNVDNEYQLSLNLTNIGARAARNIKVLIPENGGIGADTGILPGYDSTGVTLEALNPEAQQTVHLPLSITKSAAAGLRELTVQVTYEDSEGNVLTTVAKIYLTIVAPEKQEEIKNDVTISNVTQSPAQPIAGDVLTVTFQVTNNGNNDITDLALYGEELSSAGFEPLSADIRNTVGNLKKGEVKEVSMRFRVGSGITAGMNELKLAASYVDANGTSQKESTTVYILDVRQVTEEQVKNNVSISGISQSPEVPMVGERVTVSFTVNNNGTKDITELKFSGTNLGSNNFEPISSEVYTVVGSVAAGASKKVSMSFKVGSDIQEGFNALGLAYSYVDGSGNTQNETTAIYILNVKNESATSTSKPKLIVSEFSTDSEELRAGTTFNLTFALKNTHASKSAKNIKVTVVQAQDIFSATQGSNSFYIESIGAGEVSQNTMNLKVKSDTATGAYEISIKVEYEYDDMSPTDLNAGGVSDENILKLQAIENSRPAVQNLSVGYGWDTPTINQATSLMFDFYNMGKSTLSNVYVTISGDYIFESGTMQIIGSVSAGMNSYQEISILPQVEGMAKGVLTVHFEDSNGDEVSKDFDLPETYIQGEATFDWNVPSGDGSDYTGGDDLQTAKKALMPVWAYILCLAAALAAGTLLTRGIMVAVYKKKQENNDEV